MASPNKCPKCGSIMVVRTVRHGPRKGQEFLSCSRYPSCDGARNGPARCPKCNALMETKRSRSGVIFWGCSRYPSCDGSSHFIATSNVLDRRLGPDRKKKSHTKKKKKKKHW